MGHDSIITIGLFLIGNGCVIIFSAGMISQRIKHLEEAMRTMKGDLVKRHDEDRAECDRQMDIAHKRIDVIEQGQHRYGERISAIEAKCKALHEESA